MYKFLTCLLLAVCVAFAGQLWTQDFSAGTHDQWTVAEGNWMVLDEAFTNDFSEGFTSVYGGSPDWTDITYSVDMKGENGMDVWLNFRVQPGGLAHYIFVFQDSWGAAGLYRRDGDTLFNKIADATDFWPEWGKTHKVKVVLEGSSIKINVDDQLVIDHVDSTYLSGMVGMGAYRSTGVWDNIVVEGEGVEIKALNSHLIASNLLSAPKIIGGGTVLRAHVNAPEGARLELFNAHGKLLREMNVFGSQSVRVPTKGVVGGFYVLQLRADGHRVARRVILR